jgi:hypothetical protein
MIDEDFDFIKMNNFFFQASGASGFIEIDTKQDIGILNGFFSFFFFISQQPSLPDPTKTISKSRDNRRRK